MPQNFLFPQRDQPMLLPVDMREWLPGDDLVFIVLDAVVALDLGEFRRVYRADGRGRAAFDPEMMVALLLYGYGPQLRTVLAGSGYVSEENFARADQDKLRLLAPLAKDPGRAGAPPSGPGTWISIRPPPAPSGACGIPADGRTTSCGPAPWNRCPGNSRPARN